MRHPVFKALAAQFSGFIFAYSLALSGQVPHIGIFWLACLQAALAAIVSALLVAPRWWHIIHLGFMPGIVLASLLNIPNYVYATSFFILLLTFWNASGSQIPLFLSNKTTTHRLAGWLVDSPSLRVLDIGSGTGSFALHLAKLRPDWQISGVETAPIPLVLAKWLGRNHKNLSFSREDFWGHSLRDYDVVYAFLSPAPMKKLWSKAQKEMRAGTLLVSNSFVIPNVPADNVIYIEDRRQTALFIYRITNHRSNRTFGDSSAD